MNTSTDAELFDCCKRYFDATEQHDLAVCRFRCDRGYGMPTTPHEMGRVGKFAKDARDRIFGDLWRQHRREIDQMLDYIERLHGPYYTGRNT